MIKILPPTAPFPCYPSCTNYTLPATILQHRLASELDSYIRPTQYGFRSARGTRHALFLVRRIQDWSRALSKPMHMLFLDWKQAFDTLDHSALIKGLQRWNIHPGYIEIIQDFYTSPEFSIMGMNGQVATGAVSSGIRQGCPLSPYLFILILSLILEDTELRLIQQGTPTNTWSIGKPVFDVEYADDTLIFGISTPQLESMLQALEQEASKYGMSLNFAKSELLVSDPQSDAAMNFANGQPVPITTSVKYLGSVVTWDHPTETAIAARFSIARTALQSIRLVWNSRLPQTAKLCIFHSVVVSSLTYGLNCLTLAHKHVKLIDGYYFRLLRRVLGIPASYISRVSNFTVWQRAGKPTTASQIVLKQRKFYLKCWPLRRTIHIITSFLAQPTGIVLLQHKRQQEAALHNIGYKTCLVFFKNPPTSTFLITLPFKTL